MAKCFDLVGYKEQCNAVHNIPTGRAAIFSFHAGMDSTFRSLMTLSDNGMSVSQIYNETDWSAVFSQYKADDGVVLPLFIDAQNPFAITIQGNTDSGRVMYHKTVHCSLFYDSNGKAEGFIQGMIHSKEAGGLVIERDRTDSADIFGAYDSIKIDPTSVTRSEYENGGAWEFDLYCDEPVPNVRATMQYLNLALNSLTA